MSDDSKEVAGWEKIRKESDEAFEEKLKNKPKNIMSIIEAGLDIGFDGIKKFSDENNSARRKKYAQLSSQEKFKFYARLESWGLKSEAIPLILGYSPEYLQALDDYPEKEADVIFKIAESCIYDSLPILNPDDSVNKWKISSSSFIDWACKNNIGISPEFFTVYKNENPEYFCNKRHSESNLPEYSTPLLRIAIYVINEFWEGVDVARAPSSEWIVGHLIEKFELDGRDAKVVDALTRDPSRRKKIYSSDI